jgi:hypothetical protein
LKHTGTGQYSGTIPTTNLLATDSNYSNAYYLYTRLYDDNNTGQTLAEDNHFDIFFNNNPALAPKNFTIEKQQKSVSATGETYDLKFNWSASDNAAKYVLYRTQSKSATLFSDPCSISDVKFGHRFGDSGATTPYCETTIQQNVGNDDTTQWKEMATISAPATTVTIPWSQLEADQTGNVYYYLLRAQNSTNESGYSTMLVSVKKHFVTNNAPLTSINWSALPYYFGNITDSQLTAQHITKASDIVKDIEGGTTGSVGNELNKKINRVAIWTAGSQTASSAYTYSVMLHKWTGSDFSINPGDSVYLQASSQGGFDWTIVGGDAVDTLGFQPNTTTGATNFNWVSIPFTSKYQTASDIVNDIEGSTVGTSLAERNRYINRVAIWSSDSQVASSAYTYNALAHRWTGADFTINPGDGVFIQLSNGQLPFNWTPPLLINPYN